MHRERDLDIRPELRDELFEAMRGGDPIELAHAWRTRERTTGSADAPLAPVQRALVDDLELDTVWRAMAAGDPFLYETARRVILSSLRDPQEILYRQAVMRDCLERRAVVRELHQLAIEALESERRMGVLWSHATPDSVLRRSVGVLTRYLDALRGLRRLAGEHARDFRSPGFTRLFAMLGDELDDEYLGAMERRLAELRFERGLLESAALGMGDRGRDYVVHLRRERHWTERLPFRDRGASCGFTIPPRDENGFRALDELRARGVGRVADAVARSADHVKGFFAMLRLELAFYVACLNLQDALEAGGAVTCIPEPAEGTRALSAGGLYDVSLALHLDGRVVANDLDADGRSLVMITGANQGGKSTFLRAAGLAQLMLQCGMPVGAAWLRADPVSGVFTHYKREEDARMEGGKLDEELQRMSEIADSIAPGALLLCNESFASTNEREGSEIARQVVRAMRARGIRVIFVTHMYDLAHGLYREADDAALFLRPERAPDGRRTFRLHEGEPQTTSYGPDSYERIFGHALLDRRGAA